MPTINTGVMQAMSDNNKVDENNWTMSSMSGDNRTRVNHGVMSTMSGDNKAWENYWEMTSMSGDASGEMNYAWWRISTMSGDIEFGRNDGVMESKSWDITVWQNNGLMISISGTLETELPPIKAVLEAVWTIMSRWWATIISWGGNISIVNGRVFMNGREVNQWWDESWLGGKLKVNELTIDIKDGTFTGWLFQNRSSWVVPEGQPTQVGQYVVYKEWKKIAVNVWDHIVLCDAEIWKIAMLPAAWLGKFQNIFNQWDQPRIGR